VDVFSFLTRWFDAQMRSEAALKDAKGMLSLVSLPALPSQVVLSPLTWILADYILASLNHMLAHAEVGMHSNKRHIHT
jgi:hypothetical protein